MKEEEKRSPAGAKVFCFTTNQSALTPSGLGKIEDTYTTPRTELRKKGKGKYS